MIQLSDGLTIVRPCRVQGGSGLYAYYIGFSTQDGFPEVGLEENLRVHDSRLAGMHFQTSGGQDWIIVRGSSAGITKTQLAELEEHLGLKRKEPEPVED